MSLQQEVPSDQDGAAWNEFDAYWLPLLTKELRRRLGGMDGHVVEEAAEDSLLVLQKNPEKYPDCTGDEILPELEAQAYGRIRNKTRQRYRRSRHERTWGVSAEDFCRICVQKEGSAGLIYREAVNSPLSDAISGVVSGLSAKEQVEASLLGEDASWEEWARILGIRHLPEPEQRCLVSKEKQRVKKKLRRRLVRALPEKGRG
jgi:hypothetical protein